MTTTLLPVLIYITLLHVQHKWRAWFYNFFPPIFQPNTPAFIGVFGQNIGGKKL